MKKFIVIDDLVQNLKDFEEAITSTFMDGAYTFSCVSEKGEITQSLDRWDWKAEHVNFELDDIDAFVSNFIDDINEQDDIMLIDLALTRPERVRLDVDRPITDYENLITHTPQIIMKIKSEKPSTKIKVISLYGSNAKWQRSNPPLVEPSIHFPKFLHSIHGEQWFGTIKYMLTPSVKRIRKFANRRAELLSF